MPSTIYVHLTWTTHQRSSLINAACAGFLRRLLPNVARRHGASVVEIGIVADHVHIVLLLPPVVDIPRLVQSLKGASARIANRDRIVKGVKLRWARGYDLRSVSPWGLERLRRYVRSQAEKHPHSRVDE